MKGKKNEESLLDAQRYFSDIPLLTTAAHELKAPLALIRQLGLGLETGEYTDSERARMMRQVVLTTERALRLTTDLTRASRLQDSFFELEPLNPQQICEEVAHELSPLYKAKNREIVVAPRHRRMLVVGNRDLLRRIVLNFGDNALSYAETEKPVELRMARVEGGQRVRIGVRDYGPAIPSDVWRRLRTQLGVGMQLLHARPQSSGLGLYVASQFADAMRGTIGATRHHDGATFYVDVDASTQLRLW